MSIYTRIRFGKHKGKLLTEIPRGYLAWLMGLEDLDRWLQQDVQEELNRRRGQESRQQYEQEREGNQQNDASLLDWPRIITTWHRELVIRFHPDKGGSCEAVAAINHAVDRLKELLASTQGHEDVVGTAIARTRLCEAERHQVVGQIYRALAREWSLASRFDIDIFVLRPQAEPRLNSEANAAGLF